MNGIEIRVGRRLVIRAAGRFAVLLIVLGFLVTVLIVSDRLERNAPVGVVWNAAPDERSWWRRSPTRLRRSSSRIMRRRGDGCYADRAISIDWS
ncbi:hypothetical protein H9Q09_04980 [Aurantimonas sp. DM33-3]|uniref:hypothetical protein n=1 Tax=Aurantimonas sp. DM33-3 TaxID=2766955 RepID=UPI00165200D0|nr:hypothetical protein [Aurantimonas sp. DM33-3]MBC6715546.1 hypothetical protein [Aurantimonas sp. DM33-3]